MSAPGVRLYGHRKLKPSYLSATVFGLSSKSENFKRRNTASFRGTESKRNGANLSRRKVRRAVNTTEWPSANCWTTVFRDEKNSVMRAWRFLCRTNHSRISRNGLAH